MKINFAYLICFIIFGTTLSGCSYKPLESSDKMKIEFCINMLKATKEGYEKYHSVSNATNDIELERLKHEEYELAVSGLAAMEEYYERVKLSGLKEDFKWKYPHWGAYETEEKCPYDAIERTVGYDIKSIQARKTRELANEIRNNISREYEKIDKAQDDVLNEYKRKAVKHYSDTSGRFRVDTFSMKNGQIITCKTSVTDAGKAVDCR